MSDDIISYPWRLENGGLVITVRLTPRGGREAIDGINTLANGCCVLSVRVRPPPEDGAANTALIKLLAKTTGIPASAVRIESGHTSRLKKLYLSGDPSIIEPRLISFLTKT
ncbi:DUF167 family protein [Pseudochelatococcus sp. G4_1912]|uniref:DUF167 family protein n=1 Tax=Pseudochelatococcus sp. G4_1912 TaxID=3114288 RepID=UPI0039C699C7